MVQQATPKISYAIRVNATSSSSLSALSRMRLLHQYDGVPKFATQLEPRNEGWRVESSTAMALVGQHGGPVPVVHTQRGIGGRGAATIHSWYACSMSAALLNSAKPDLVALPCRPRLDRARTQQRRPHHLRLLTCTWRRGWDSAVDHRALARRQLQAQLGWV